MTSADIAARAEVAKRLAREAGALARRYFRREIDFTAETKGPQDFVGAADHVVEALIRDRLTREFPSDAVLGEESGGEAGRHVWVLDPIDGTKSFISGVRCWGISIGYISGGARCIGVIYDPSLDELFWSVKGSGAWCDDTLIHVSPRDRLDHALVCAT